MRKLLFTISVCAVVACVLSAAQAETITFTPPSGWRDLGDLNHNWYYSWGISWRIPTGYTIQSATLYINNINNWKRETNDALYIRLLDAPKAGVDAVYDGETVLDQWDWRATDANHMVHPEYGTSRPLIDLYQDRDGSYGDPTVYHNGTNLAYSFGSIVDSKTGLTLLQSLNNFVLDSDGRFGFGFDPDCHYFNSGIKFEITTSPLNPSIAVPEPFSMFLGTIGMGMIAAARRLRRY